jgi:hypothetical protein
MRLPCPRSRRPEGRPSINQGAPRAAGRTREAAEADDIHNKKGRLAYAGRPDSFKPHSLSGFFAEIVMCFTRRAIAGKGQSTIDKIATGARG